ncbi:MAG: class I mannose-6-phosphate isomerase [Anaerolineae bacterium]|nr:class I mannose-6-phosphate isomerase [Thermoflexales bacterium]MDW8407390.1 class I mannose-6-phosphate isomerase [Anaerolineae bacterium]
MSRELTRPMMFRPALKDKIWGGQRLGRMYHLAETHRSIGEAWLVEESLCATGGAYPGHTLHEIVNLEASAILGARGLAAGCSSVTQVCHFPLLIKLLDAADVLSVQVHPDDTYAQRREGQPFGKCEAWLVLEAEPGAKIIHGFKSRLSRDELRDLIEHNRLAEVLQEVEVKPGDVVLNTPGTVHALGAGLLVYELQQFSDLTYRLYDWGRLEAGRPRTLHIDQSLDVADLEPLSQHQIEPVTVQEVGVTRAYMVATPYFAGELLTIEGVSTEDTRAATFHIVTALRGEGSVTYTEDGHNHDLNLSAGESIVVPACLGRYHLVATHQPWIVAKAYVPDLLADIAQPLLARGVAPSSIAQLGGDGDRSALRRLLATQQ